LKKENEELRERNRKLQEAFGNKQARGSIQIGTPLPSTKDERIMEQRNMSPPKERFNWIFLY